MFQFYYRYTCELYVGIRLVWSLPPARKFSCSLRLNGAGRLLRLTKTVNGADHQYHGIYIKTICQGCVTLGPVRPTRHRAARRIFDSITAAVCVNDLLRMAVHAPAAKKAVSVLRPHALLGAVAGRTAVLAMFGARRFIYSCWYAA